MSQQNVENTRRGIDAWNRGDLDEWLAGFAPEAELHTTVTFKGRGKRSGVPIEGPIWFVTFRDGLAVRGETYVDSTKAIEAAGRSE